jgi:tripartite-type tricarboxylate transporter receptor subunit TctC
MWAQTYPGKPVKILVGFSPRGGPDTIARLLAQKLTEEWRQPVLVENRVGAGSNIAAQALANSTADGYTLLSVSSAHAICPAIYAKLPYDVVKDFSGVMISATGPALVIVSPQLGVDTLQEFIALTKTPRAIVDKLQVDVAAILKQAQVQQRFAPLGIEPVTSSPEAFDQLVHDEVQMFKKLALASAIKAD